MAWIARPANADGQNGGHGFAGVESDGQGEHFRIGFGSDELGSRQVIHPPAAADGY